MAKHFSISVRKLTLEWISYSLNSSYYSSNEIVPVILLPSPNCSKWNCIVLIKVPASQPPPGSIDNFYPWPALKMLGAVPHWRLLSVSVKRIHYNPSLELTQMFLEFAFKVCYLFTIYLLLAVVNIAKMQL